MYSNVLMKLALISDKLRSANSKTVQIPALCDVLWLYGNTYTYFTPNESYKKTKGDEQKIRKCDVRMATSEAGKVIAPNGEVSLNTSDQEKSVYKGFKEYDPGYIWGQLIGWFKQTVDKPNASLSADRRGTLSMPDLESFLISAKNQEDLKTGIQRKKKKKGGDQEEDEDDFDIETEVAIQKTQNGSGTRSRPPKGGENSSSSCSLLEEKK
jgi:hypothetical protein